jgi:hypothetical protein
MSVTPFRWQSASRMEQLRELALDRTERWIGQWAAAGQRPSVEVELLTAQRSEIAAADVRWYALADTDVRLSLRIAGAAFEHLGCKLAGLAVADASGLAAGIGQRALTDLARACFPGNASANAPAALTPVAGVPAAADIGARFGAIGVQVSVGTIRFELHFDSALCALLVPVSMPAGETLVSRREAVRAVDATFDAVLDLGTTALVESLSFKPGEVIKTGIPIGAGLRLVAGNGAEILSGRLVAEDGHRALKVVKATLQKSALPRHMDVPLADRSPK